MKSTREGTRRAWGRAASFLLAITVSALAACDPGPDPLAVEETDGTPGHYGGPCGADQSCGEGLVCQDHVCVTAK